MKKTIKLLTVAIATIMGIGCLTLTSCNKDSAADTLQDNPSGISRGKTVNIPYYPTWDSLYSEINIASSYTNSKDLLNHQRNRGIISIGALSDALFDSINTILDHNPINAMTFYQGNQQLVDTILLGNNEIGLVPKWFFYDFRYVANQNGTFAVGNNVYRLFKNGIASVHNNDVEFFISLTESQLSAIDTSVIHYTENYDYTSTGIHSGCNLDWTLDNSPQTSNDRIHIKLKTVAAPTDYGRWAGTSVHVFNLHYYWGAWWASRHNLSLNGSVTFHTVDNSNNWSINTFPANGSKHGFSLNVSVYGRPCDWNNLSFIDKIRAKFSKSHHYWAFNLEASYPGHSIETFSMIH